MLALEQVRDGWTVDELAGLDVEDWRRFEIVDGSLVVSPSPGKEHEFVIADLRDVLSVQLEPDLAVLGSIGVDLGGSYLIPDMVVVPRAARSSQPEGRLRSDEALLVVEVVSPGSVTMDRLVKPSKYASAGISAFWRVETDPISLTAYSLPVGANAYVEVGAWAAGEVAELAEPFPVRIDLTELADR
jgi:Uma2 family endonuclease